MGRGAGDVFLALKSTLADLAPIAPIFGLPISETSESEFSPVVGAVEPAGTSAVFFAFFFLAFFSSFFFFFFSCSAFLAASRVSLSSSLGLNLHHLLRCPNLEQYSHLPQHSSLTCPLFEHSVQNLVVSSFPVLAKSFAVPYHELFSISATLDLNSATVGLGFPSISSPSFAKIESDCSTK